MTIEILDTRIVTDIDTGQPLVRHADIIISSGQTAYLWSVGGLPVSGNLQTVLDARESELWSVASVSGRPVDLYELAVKRVLKAFALVMLDEINALRQQAGLGARTGAQIEAALKAKLKSAG